MKRTGKMILSAVLSALTFFSFGGCSGRPIGSPECGGVTDKTDHNAPKTIVSKALTSFYAHFYLRGEWSPGKGNRFYTCEVRTDEQGVLTATVWTDSLQDACVRLPADEKLLATLQSIIDTYKLVGKNGYYRVTAGLPPEFQKCHFNANYASGEKLEFTENNNPDAEWTRETYLAFANWFAEQGDDSLLPPKLSYGPIEDCRFTLSDSGRKVHLGPVHVQEKNAIDGERLLLGRSSYDVEAKEWVRDDEYIFFPEDYLEKIHAILSAYDLRAFDYHSVLYKDRKMKAEEKDFYRPVLQIHVKFKDGKHLRIDTNDDGDVETLRPLVKELLAYHDSLFEEYDG